MMGFDGFGGGMGFGGFGAGMIFFWALAIAAVIALTRWIGRSGSSAATRGELRSALDILRERYAKGEIDQREFEQKRRDVGAG